MMFSRKEREPKQPLGPFLTDVKVYAQAPESGLRVTWFGHSSTLLEIDGTKLLIDPVWDERASPFRRLGPKRFFRPTMRMGEMPKVDAVLISHDHYDHLGKATVERLAPLMPETLWVTSLEVGAALRRFGVEPGLIRELDWTDSVQVGGLTITLWDGFREIGAQYGPFDLIMLEVGAFNEAWKNIHLGPDGAAKALDMLGGGLLMPIHWGLFNLALHGWREPIERVWELGLRIFSPEPGRPEEVRELRSAWWREKP
jgi:L-ascorbate metabolism protein UlaG (beta-lactamase superfamily)